MLQSYNTEQDKWFRQDWKKDIRNHLYGAIRILKRDGEYRHKDLVFCCNETSIKGPFVSAYAVDIKWNELAAFFNTKVFRGIGINDIRGYADSLCDDDIQSLTSGYFNNYEEILVQFMIRNLISDALIEKYNLQYLKQQADEKIAKNTEAEFPAETEEEAEKLEEETKRDLEKPIKVIRCSADYPGYSIVNDDASIDTISVNYLPSKHISTVHQTLLERYRNKQDHRCFCQMCQEAWAPDFISQTDIIGISGMFWPQLYISVCFRCKNKLDTYKQNKPDYCQRVYDALIYADTDADLKFVDVLIGKGYNVHYKKSHYLAVKKIVSAYISNLSTDFREDNHQLVCDWSQKVQYSTGETIEFGRFYWDEDEKTGMRPIKWKVLSIDENRKTALLISEMGLIGGKYYSNSSITWKQWLLSPIHDWLENEFLECAFYESEKSKLVEDINGKVRLLTPEECYEYFKTNEARKLVPTPYAKKSGATTDKHKMNSGEKTCWWWLCNSMAISRGGNIKTVVQPQISIEDRVSADAHTGAVRPVIRVSIANNGQNEQQRAIYRVIVNRQITRLIHFTPVENVSSIIKHGIIPRCEAEKLGAKCMDSIRLDNHKDTVSLSISEPNFRLLYKRESQLAMDDPLKGIAILEIDPCVLLNIAPEEVSFCSNNAATKRDGDVSWHTGDSSLSAMFDNKVVDSDGFTIERQLNDLSPCHTTDPQAEILFKGSIPVKYIKRIELRSVSAIDCNEDLKANNITIDICSTDFWPKQGNPWYDYSMKCRR